MKNPMGFWGGLRFAQSLMMKSPSRPRSAACRSAYSLWHWKNGFTTLPVIGGYSQRSPKDANLRLWGWWANRPTRYASHTCAAYEERSKAAWRPSAAKFAAELKDSLNLSIPLWRILNCFYYKRQSTASFFIIALY